MALIANMNGGPLATVQDYMHLLYVLGPGLLIVQFTGMWHFVVQLLNQVSTWLSVNKLTANFTPEMPVIL